jgi:hypothetical protein
VNLKESILKTIGFFDVFDFPLTAEEMLMYLYKYDKPIHIKEVKGVLGDLAQNGLVEFIKDHYVLPGRGKIIDTRRARKFLSEKLWDRVRFYADSMRAIPFIRMIAVCNNLAYNNASEGSDIDLLVIVKPGRMWIARLLLTMMLWFYGVRRHGNHIAGRFCLSFFITTNKLHFEHLQLGPEDPYLAYWTMTLNPFYGKKTYEEFREANKAWLKETYGLNIPESVGEQLVELPERRIKVFNEWVFGGWFGKLIEGLLKRTLKKKTLASKQKLGPEASVVVDDDMLKFHNRDRRAEYREAWMKRSVYSDAGTVAGTGAETVDDKGAAGA